MQEDFETNIAAIALADELIERHGPLMGSQLIAQMLGFPSLNAFRQARLRGTVKLRVFRIEGRRGVFALTAEVAAWIQAASEAR